MKARVRIRTALEDRKMKKLTILAGVAALAVTATAASAPVTLRVGDQWTTMDPGDDHCQLSEKHEEKTVIDQLRQLNAGRNEVLSLFAPCADIQAYRAGHGDLSNASFLLAPYLEGKLLPWPSSDRREFLTFFEKVMSKGVDPARVKRLLDKLNRETEGVTIPEPVMLGILDADETAVYQGLLLPSGDGTKPMAGVVATTLVGRYVVFFNLYRPYNDESTISDLLKQIRPIAESLATASAPLGMGPLLPISAAYAAGSGSSSDGPIAAGITGLITALIILSIFGIARRIRRRRQARRTQQSASP